MADTEPLQSDFPLRERVRGLRWALAYGWRAAPRTQSLRLALLLAGAVLPMLQPLLAGRVVDAVAGRDTSATWAYVAGMVAIYLVSAPVVDAGRIRSGDIQDLVTRRVDEGVIDAGAAMPDLTRLDRPQVHDAAERLNQHVPNLVRASEIAAIVVTGWLGVAVLLATLVTVAWWLPLLLTPLLVLHLWAQTRVSRLRWTVTTKLARPAREAEYYLQTLTEPARAKEVRALGVQHWFGRRFGERAARGLAETRAVRLRTAWVDVALAIAYGLAAASAIAVVAHGVHVGSRSPGTLAVFIGAMIALGQRTMSLGGLTANQVGTSRAHADGRRFLEQARPAIHAGLLRPTQRTLLPSSNGSTITLTGVHFNYPGSDRDVLRGVDLTLPAGAVVALVGENGEGKSTLVKLLTRMYDPTAGSISWDGHDIADYDLSALRAHIATVFQDPAMFSLSVGENIGVSVPALLVDGADAGECDRRIRRAALAGGAAEVVDAIGGYDTALTRRFGGVDLSGGQWQRIATARGFVPDASLVILDEPTSALDADAERRLFDRFADLVRGRTAVMISHRFSTVRKADLIAVLRGGRIV